MDMHLATRPLQRVIGKYRLAYCKKDLFSWKLENLDCNVSLDEDVPLKDYLREIRQYPILTDDEEKTLAKLVKKGSLARALCLGARNAREFGDASGIEYKKAKRIRGLVKAGQEAAIELGFASEPAANVDLIGILCENGRQIKKIAVEAKEAKDRLITSNLHLVLPIAKCYVGCGLSLFDLIQEGNLGLIEAAEKFNHRVRFRFATYAKIKINYVVIRAIAYQSTLFHIPVQTVILIRKLQQIAEEFFQTHGVEPTVEDLSHITEVDVSTIQKVLHAPVVLSLDTLLHSDNGVDLIEDYIEDSHAPSPFREGVVLLMGEELERILNELDPDERESIRLLPDIGYCDYTYEDMETISIKSNLPPERVRQLAIKGIEKLKHPARQARLRLRRFLPLLD